MDSVKGEEPMPGSALRKWYFSEVYMLRTIATTIWTVIIALVVLFIQSLVMNVHLFSPVTWLLISLNRFTPITWFPLLIFICFICISSLVKSSKLTVELNLPKNALTVFYIILHPKNLLGVFLDTWTSVIQAWCIVWIVLEKGTSTSSLFHESRLDEETLFIIFTSGVSGFCSSVYSLITAEHVLAFPILRQPKYFQLHNQLFPALKRSFAKSVRLLGVSIVCYWFFGELVKSSAVFTFQLQVSSDDRPINSLLGLLYPRLLLKALLVVTSLQLITMLNRRVLHAYHSESLNLPIVPIFEQSRDLNLGEALLVKEAPLLTHLAFYQLAQVSATSHLARQDIFSLSHPGGHPHTWRKVSHACLSLLRTLTEEVVAYNQAELGSSFIPVQQRVQQLNDSCPNSRTSDAILRKRFGSPWKSNGKQQETSSLTGKGSLISSFSDQPLISAVVRELPEVRSRQLFCLAQRHVWATEALSALAVHSYTEDTHGVVQRVLPEIFDVLLRLYEAVEKHVKLSGASRRSVHPLLPPVNAGVKLQLRDAVRTALYRLCSRFSAHFNDLDFSFEQRSRLDMFVQYRE